MYACERCDDDVEQVLRYREYGTTVTHRVTRWLCHDCHPTAPARGEAVSGASGSSERVVTDGGTTR